jgi:hypothetical protein
LSTPRNGAVALFACVLKLFFLSFFLSFLLHAVFSFTPWSTDLTVRRLGNKQSVMRTQEELEEESKSDKVESEETEFPDKQSNASTERERERERERELHEKSFFLEQSRMRGKKRK